MADEDPYHSELGFVIDGELEISEREGAEQPHTSLNLVTRQKSIKVEIGYSADEDITEERGFYISLRCYHAKNSETGRVFHGSLKVWPDCAQIRKIRDYCTYLLTLGDPL